ncbi:MAG: hypothetical protein WCC27_11270 [Acidobacteriaceae bacterium]
MIKKQSNVALALFLLIPAVLVLGGGLSILINPEVAAGHPNYARNWHLLHEMQRALFWGSVACAGVLWVLVCLLAIRAKQRSYLWLPLAVLGPLGFAVLAMLNNRTPGAATDRYSRFLTKLNWWMRGGWELGSFVLIWVLAWEAMVLKRTLTIQYEAFTTGVSPAEIMRIRDASGGMWAFSEGNEVWFFAILLYLLRPYIFRMMGHLAGRMSSRGAG